MKGVRLHPEVETDLWDIADYIGSDNPSAGLRLLGEIKAAMGSLAKFPHRGHRRPDLTSRPLRFILVRDYLIAYAPDRMPVWIIAVIHGHRDPRVMAAILRSRED